MCLPSSSGRRPGLELVRKLSGITLCPSSVPECIVLLLLGLLSKCRSRPKVLCTISVCGCGCERRPAELIRVRTSRWGLSRCSRLHACSGC